MEKEQFDKTVEHFQEELKSLRTNQANPSMVENINVEAYNSTMKIQELATISMPEPQMLVIQPWDKTVVKQIETALRECDQKFQPVVDGEVIRISFPPLTEEKRKEMVKIVNDKAEDARIALRKVREEYLKELKQQEKDGEISEDEYFREEKEMQKVIGEYNDKVKELADNKAEGLMTV